LGFGTGPTGTASIAGTSLFGVTGSTSLGIRVPTGPTGALPFQARAVLEIDANLLTGVSLQHVGVPRLGELILCIFIRPEHQKEQLARYEERFNDWSRKFGARTARRLYWFHAIQSIFDMLKISAIGAFLDWIYDRFSGKP
jgi:hypothetical protein